MTDKIDFDDMEYAPMLRQFDLRPLPDRFDACPMTDKIDFDDRELTELEQAEAELEECDNDLIDVAKQRDAAIARAEAAKAALAQCQQELEASDTLLKIENWQAGWKARAEAAEAALAELRTPCEWWRADDGFFETSCKAPRYTSRAPKFCQNCGHPVAKVLP